MRECHYKIEMECRAFLDHLETGNTPMNRQEMINRFIACVKKAPYIDYSNWIIGISNDPDKPYRASLDKVTH